jgi:hypothetical protein
MLPTLHDSEITGISSDRTARTLRIYVRLPDGGKAIVEMRNVFGWKISEFEEQNVAFHVATHEANTALDDVGDFEIEPGHLQWLRDERGVLLTIEPSVGLGGYVVGKEAHYQILPASAP